MRETWTQPSIVIATVSALMALLALLVAWFSHRHNVEMGQKADKATELAEAERQKAEERQRLAEARLARMERLGRGPLFFLSNKRFESLQLPHVWLHHTSPDVLCFNRPEVPPDKLLKGAPVYVVIENRGKDALYATFQTIGSVATLHMDVKINERHSGLCVLEYAFDPEAFGTRQILQIDFLSSNGFEDTHRYAFEHGRRKFFRVEPEPRRATALQQKDGVRQSAQNAAV